MSSLPDNGASATVLIAPDSFKGTFSAPEVADALARGVERAGLRADRCPVADGGEGTLDALLAAVGGSRVAAPAHDPLGRPIDGLFGLIDGGGTAIVETATATGLYLLTDEERDPWTVTSAGTGELIVAAAQSGAETLLVAVGGSATVDGGSGMMATLEGHESELARMRIIVLCDVETSWEHSAEVFGPQKGADPEMVVRLTERLHRQAEALPRDPRGIAYTGGAGGIPGALWSVYGAELVSGAARMLETVGFEPRMRDAAAVICGEGRIDFQSVEGKIVGEVAGRAAAVGVPAYAVVGRNDLNEAERARLGLRAIIAASTLAEIERAGEQIAQAAAASPP